MRAVWLALAAACWASLAPAQAQDRRGYMGVNLAAEGPVRAAEGRQFAGCIRLTRVVEGGPAAKSGLRVDDRIVAVPGVTFGADRDVNMGAFRGLLAGLAPGQVLKLTVVST